MTSGLNDYADKRSQLCFCVDITMAPFLSSHTGGDFVKPNKESASQRHSQENSLHESIIKKFAICYTYMETPFSSSPVLTCLVNILLLQTDYWKLIFATVNNDPQHEQDNSFVIFYCSQSRRSSLSQSCAAYCAGLEEEPSYLVTCLSPEIHSLLLKEKRVQLVSGNTPSSESDSVL